MHQLGVGFVPADRHRYGMVLSFPLTDNLVPQRLLPRSVRARPGPRRRGDPAHMPTGLIAEYDVRTPSATVTAGTLSGGNQQKVVVGAGVRRRAAPARARPADARPRRRQHRVHPSPGDREARRWRGGRCSSRPSSTRCSSCRTGSAVMYRGRIVEVLDARSTNREEVGLLMATGGREGLPRRRRATRDRRPGHAARRCVTRIRRRRRSPTEPPRRRPR